MSESLPLRTAIKRGALVTAANWPVIVIEFIVVSIARVALAVPIVGGAFMVAVLSNADISSIFAGGLRSAAGIVIASLLNRPAALWSFVLALCVVAAGSGVISWLAQAGVMGTLAAGEREAGDLHRPPLRMAALNRARAFTIEGFLAAVSKFGRRFVLLGAWLYAGYAVLAILAVATLVLATRLAGRDGWSVVLPLSAVLVTAVGLVVVGALQLTHALLQTIMTTDDCRLSVSVARLRLFLLHDARQVLGIFGVVLLLVVLAMAASVLATTGLALIAWVPLVGLAVVPLQLAAWLVRGVIFQYMDLTAWSAYQSQYRRYAEPEAADAELPAVRMFSA
ncbi:MAG TPA: hypothetical protein VMZ90_10730 [Vicinamibacterales bacterium]|nr:hypothetical protein [Vicinamibacterales bacterium]